MVTLEEALGTSRFKSNLHKAMLNVLYTAYWMNDTLSRPLKCIGLTGEQFNVLRILKGKHPKTMCVKDIASRMIERNSNVPRIADRLEAKSLVHRTHSEKDGRMTLIGLTDKGLKTLLAANKAVEKINRETINLDEEEAATLHNILEKLRIKDTP